MSWWPKRSPTGRFLVLTTDEARDELRERGNDVEAYIERIVQDYT